MLYKKVLIIIICLFISVQSFSQNEKNALRLKKERLENEIKKTSTQLNLTKKNKQAYLNQVLLLNKQISIRENIISAINLQVNSIDDEAIKTRDTILSLSKNLTQLKKDYSKIIYQIYKTKNEQSKLMFIFSSKNFHQAYLRMKYLQQYTDYRKEQASKITNVTRKLGTKLHLLETQKKDKLSLLQNKEHEKQSLFGEKEEQNKNINQLTQKEKALLKTLREHEQSVQRLQDAIERIIAEEVRRVNTIKRKNSTTNKGKINPGKYETAKTEYVYSLTPEDIKLSSSFEKNRGRLPWPVDKGSISDYFGEQPHAELKGIMIKNNGINIETTAGSVAKSVFEGVVTGIISIPNFNNVVIIRHGEFLTVYSNLKTVSIAKGENVKTLQQIGVIYSDPNTNKTKIHFEIWKGKVLLNPNGWIRK